MSKAEENTNTDITYTIETVTPIEEVIASKKDDQQSPHLPEVFMCIADTSRPNFTKTVLDFWLELHKNKQIELYVLAPIDNIGKVNDMIRDQVVGTGVKIVAVGSGDSAKGASITEFQRNRRVWPQALATGEWYWVVDDDCMPKLNSIIAKMQEVVDRHPRAKEFGVLVAWPANAKIYKWRPGIEETVRREVYTDTEIWEHVSVGGIRMCQKAAHPEGVEAWEEMKEKGGDGKYRYDRTHADMLRKQGWRSGLMRGVEMIHLGEQVRHDDSGHPEHPEEPDFEV